MVPEVASPTPGETTINEDGHVLKSRRGLLAAGLAVAVVGAIGVVSTVNAGADQIVSPLGASSAPVDADAPGAVADAPDGDAPDADASDASAPVELTPQPEPPKLPW